MYSEIKNKIKLTQKIRELCAVDIAIFDAEKRCLSNGLSSGV
jgi:hypothetical protein